MGYYTSYELNQTGCKEENFENLEKEVDALNVFECGDAGIGWCGVAKWYDHDEDMIRISKQFPDVVFDLAGHGDDQDDIWKTYYKDGKMQEGAMYVVCESFDESKLVPPNNLRVR